MVQNPNVKTQASTVFKHGIYRDHRQPTGYCWYCPPMDWRSPSAHPDDHMLLFCPSCGLGVTPELNEKAELRMAEGFFFANGGVSILLGSWGLIACGYMTHLLVTSKPLTPWFWLGAILGVAFVYAGGKALSKGIARLINACLMKEDTNQGVA